jgi:hypothetical protein
MRPGPSVGRGKACRALLPLRVIPVPCRPDFQFYLLTNSLFAIIFTIMLLPDLQFITLIERITNDLASTLGIAALFYSILKKN